MHVQTSVTRRNSWAAVLEQEDTVRRRWQVHGDWTSRLRAMALLGKVMDISEGYFLRRVRLQSTAAMNLLLLE